MAKYEISKIPDLDSTEFNTFRSARRTGEYFFQRIDDDILDLGHTIGWIPVGKTSDLKVLQASDKPSDIAIMYSWETKPEEMIWFHL